MNAFISFDKVGFDKIQNNKLSQTLLSQTKEMRLISSHRELNKVSIMKIEMTIGSQSVTNRSTNW